MKSDTTGDTWHLFCLCQDRGLLIWQIDRSDVRGDLLMDHRYDCEMYRDDESGHGYDVQVHSGSGKLKDDTDLQTR